jgi:SAM-dependent methyltransferase
MKPIVTRASRNEISLQLLDGKVRPKSRALDCGSRDGSLLLALKAKYDASRLVALDWYNRVENCVEFRSHNLETPLPFSDRSFDIVVCNDVLEHVENKWHLFSELLRIADRHVLISLPNTQYWRFIYGLVKGRMSKQYNFLVDDGVDRHRWITYYEQNIEFIERGVSDGWIIESRMECTTERKIPLCLVRKFRKYLVFNQLFLLKRTA